MKRKPDQWKGTVHKQAPVHLDISYVLKVVPQIMRQRQTLNGTRTTDQPFGKKIQLGPYLTPYTSMNFKWISDLDVKK